MDVFDKFYGTLRHVIIIDPDLSGFDIFVSLPQLLIFLNLALMRTHEIFPGPFQDRKWSLLRRKLVKSATQRLGQNSKIDFYSWKKFRIGLCLRRFNHYIPSTFSFSWTLQQESLLTMVHDCFSVNIFSGKVSVRDLF